MSNNDKRTVTTDALETLGTIHTREERRDAIHLAVEPVMATETLIPGAHINAKDGKAWRVPVGMGLGIVDPFLTRPVEQGERFWFVMYPRMVHSLRHVWTHPAFPDEPGTPSVEPRVTEVKLASETIERLAVKLASETIERLADQAGCSVERLMRGAAYYLESGECLHFGYDLDYSWDADGFWHCYAIVTGQKVRDDAGSFFSCSC